MRTGAWVVAAAWLAGATAPAAGPELVVQTGHQKAVTRVAWSPDGAYVVSASDDASVVIWDAVKGTRLRTFPGGSSHPEWRGDRLVTIHSEAGAVVWDARTGARLRELGTGDKPKVAALSPDGTRVATAGAAVAIWDAATGARLADLGAARGPVPLAWSPDGARVAVSSGGGEVRVWRATGGRPVCEIPADGSEIKSVRFSPRGTRVLTTNTRGAVQIWDAETGAAVRSLPKLEAWSVHEADWSVGGVIAVASGVSPTLWDAASPTTPRPLAEHRKGARAVAFSPDGRRVASGGEDGSLRVSDVASAKPVTEMLAPVAPAGAVAWSRAGGLFAAEWDGVSVLWSEALGGRIGLFAAPAEGGYHGAHSLAFSPDGRELSAGLSTGKVVTWDTTTGAELRSVAHHRVKVVSLAYSPDGAKMACGSDDSTGSVWDRATGELHGQLPGTVWMTSVAFRPDGAHLAVAHAGGAVDVFDVAARKQVASYAPHEGMAYAVAYSPDGSKLLTADQKRATVWDAATQKPLRTLPGDEWTVPAAAWSPAGNRVVTGHGDGRVAVWDPDTGRLVADRRTHLQGVRGIAFDKSGRFFLTTSFDGTVRLWAGETGEELAALVAINRGIDWLVCTPDGLFDGSAGGRNRVGYRTDGKLNVVPVDRFFKDFYRPGLLAAILRGERPKPDTDFAAQQPPAVRIASPAPGETERELAQVVVEAEDRGGGAQPPWLKQNGVRVAPSSAASRDGKVVRRTFNVSLAPGANVLEAASASADGSWESEPARVTLTHNRPVEKPRLFLIAVGAGKYAEDAMTLQYPAADARAVAELFRRRGGGLFASVEAAVLTDERATRDGVRAAFAAAAKAAKPQDAVVAYFSGHGALAGQRYYFLPAEFRRDAAATTEDAARKLGLPDDELADLLVGVPALKRVLVLDTCNAGGAAALFALRGKSPDGLRGTVERLNRTAGVFALAAAPANASAQEVAELGHGVLTYALLAGLRAAPGGPLRDDRGAEPAGAEPVADVLGLFTYAGGQVPRLMKRYFGREQDVQMSATGASFPLLPLRD